MSAPDGLTAVAADGGRLNETAAPRRRLVRALSWLLWIAALLLAALGLLLSAVNGLNVTDIFARFLAVNALSAVTFATTGAVIVSRRQGNRIGWLLCIVGLTSAGETFAGPYARCALLTRPAAFPGGQLAAWINLWC